MVNHCPARKFARIHPVLSKFKSKLEYAGSVQKKKLKKSPPNMTSECILLFKNLNLKIFSEQILDIFHNYRYHFSEW